MRAMILAAGLGTRMRPLTLSRPKPLLKAGGKALIEYHIERLARIGVERIVINHAWLGEQIEAELGDGERFGVPLFYSAETEPLETAGGIRRALPMLADDEDESFLVINGDVYTELSDDTLSALSLSPKRQAHLLLVDNPPWHPNGDFHLQGEKVSAEGAPRLTFAGISLLRASMFTDLTPGQPAALAPMLREAMAVNAVGGSKIEAFWDDIGTPERLSALDQRLRGEC
ncbi:nucleotidyltransferase family protein [Marinobacterium sp. D7]|uniref:N-acetylmuramate alpha-1-phosphate uridylyltransferase MurU n=1 Tax=Marinobacterium ramblicola TaxID=2849041 RepID=UPI001C2D2C41|nr:nucleotidyltransferase family protein [Marinobacterium ramblicola]MBV1787325.1 nucleotidyltransferase family protein [Marinobacterium ramblicola]